MSILPPASCLHSHGSCIPQGTQPADDIRLTSSAYCGTLNLPICIASRNSISPIIPAKKQPIPSSLFHPPDMRAISNFLTSALSQSLTNCSDKLKHMVGGNVFTHLTLPTTV